MAEDLEQLRKDTWRMLEHADRLLAQLQGAVMPITMRAPTADYGAANQSLNHYQRPGRTLRAQPEYVPVAAPATERQALHDASIREFMGAPAQTYDMRDKADRKALARRLRGE